MKIKKSIRNYIFAAIAFLALGIGGFWTYYDHTTKVAETPLRLHVIANSDSTYDQEVKLMVRDKILQSLESYIGDAKTKEDAMQGISLHLAQIEADCNEVLAPLASYGAKPILAKSEFPSRSYGVLVLPSGEYDALRIVLGAGEGKNWWCVLFPPLCFVDAAGNFESVAASAGNEALPVTDENIEVRLKVMDFLR